MEPVAVVLMALTAIASVEGAPGPPATTTTTAFTIARHWLRARPELCRPRTCVPWAQCVVPANGIESPRCGCETQCAPSNRVNREVCASNGVTYGSKCEMRKAACGRRVKLKVVHRGPCVSDPCENVRCSPGKRCIPNPANPAVPKCICDIRCNPADKSFACGTDHLNYHNPCYLRLRACEDRTNVTLLHMGMCAHSPMATQSEQGTVNAPAPTRPASGFSCSQCSDYTHCHVKKQVCSCARCGHVTPSPVCGSDDKTYENACRLYRVACLNKVDTTVAYDGRCKDALLELPRPCRGVQCQYGAICEVQGSRGICVCPRFCPNYEQLVCGSNGKTFRNPCVLKQARCHDPSLSEAHTGACRQISTTTTNAPSVSTPTSSISTADICRGTQCPDGQYCTASNGQPHCSCITNCSRNSIDKVCGSDGLNYLSACVLRAQACIRGVSVTVAKRGGCDEDPCTNVECSYHGICHVENGQPRCRCERNCSKEANVVCGSNHVLYLNRCVMERYICIHREIVGVVPMIRGSQCGFQGDSSTEEPDSSRDVATPPTSKTPIATATQSTMTATALIPMTTKPSTDTPQLAASPVTCLKCGDVQSLLVAFPKACRADVVASGQINRQSMVHVADNTYQYSFRVDKFHKSPPPASQVGGNNKIITVQLKSTCGCNVETDLILAGHWVSSTAAGSDSGDSALSLESSSRAASTPDSPSGGGGNYFEVSGAEGVLMPLSWKPWKLWQGMYRYQRGLRQLVCRQHSLTGV